MIVGRYLNKEVLKTMIVVLLVLLLLFVGQRFVQYLTDAAQGNIGSDLVVKLLLLQVPVFVSYLIPLSFFLALLITIGKMHTDNEMTVIAACGISNKIIIKSFAPLVTVLVLLTGYLTLFQAPTTIYVQQELIKEQQNKGDLSLITPGRFQQTSDGKRIVYVETMDDELAMQKVFFVEQNDQQEYGFSLIVSEKGQYWNDQEQNNFLVLENGNQYRGSPGNNRLQNVSFDKYYMEIKTDKFSQKISKLKARPTTELITQSSSENQAELQWRLAAPISIPLLILLALPFAKVPPRQGKFARLLPGLMIYICYMILILTMRSGMEDEKISPLIGTWWVHVVLCIYAYSEFTNWQWYKTFKEKRKLASNQGTTK